MTNYLSFLQEDTHIATLNFCPEKKLSIFGVFDGHGGREVAHFTEHNIRNIIKNSEEFKQSRYCDALKRSFL